MIHGALPEWKGGSAVSELPFRFKADPRAGERRPPAGQGATAPADVEENDNVVTTRVCISFGEAQSLSSVWCLSFAVSSFGTFSRAATGSIVRMRNWRFRDTLSPAPGCTATDRDMGEVSLILRPVLFPLVNLPWHLSWVRGEVPRGRGWELLPRAIFLLGVQPGSGSDTYLQ